MKILSYIFYLLCLPAFLLSPFPLSSYEKTFLFQERGKAWNAPMDAYGNVNPWILLHPENLSIDDYFAFIEHACDESFLESLSEEEFDTVVHFMTTMLRSSVPESLEELVEAYDQDIEQILDELYGREKWKIACSHGFEFKIASPLLYENFEVSLCKNWFARKAHHFGHWCKKHKKPLIAGAVVVGVVTVAALTGGVGGSSAAAVGGALIQDTYSREEFPQHINKPGEVYVDNETKASPAPLYPPKTEYTSTSLNQPTPLEQAHVLTFEKVEEAKLEITENIQNQSIIPSETYLEKVKDVTKVTVSNIVHDVFDSISKVGATWHEIHPNSTPEDVQAYKEFVAAQHEKIDEIFGTHRPDYTLESQAHAAAYKAAIIEELGYYPEIQVGELPPPGALINAISRAATIASRTLGTVAKSGSAIGTAATVGSLIKGQEPVPMDQTNNAIIESTETSSQFFEKNLKHIFRDDPGHLVDTPSNRNLLLDVAGDSKNYLGKDKHGNSWHAKTQEDGTQIWTISRNREIRDGGINENPQTFHKKTGLSKSMKPSQK